jgi:hypothetical protein
VIAYSSVFGGLFSVSILLAGCGESKPAASPSPASSSGSGDGASASSSSSAAPAASSGAAPVDKHAAAEAAPHDDPNEKPGPIVLPNLVERGAPKASFPKAKVGDHECLKGLPLAGKHKDDYATIVNACGTPTGMMQYTTPAEGRLHAKLDQKDHFQLKVFKNMCYRYFAVGDDGIKDIDIVITKKGALVAMDKTDNQIAVIESDKLWCVDDDMDLDFAVVIDGPGAGGYTFGVWTRPK